MSYKFIVGKTYRGIDRRMKPMVVISRTKCNICCKIGDREVGLRVKHDENNNEYIIDNNNCSELLRGLWVYEAEDDYHG